MSPAEKPLYFISKEGAHNPAPLHVLTASEIGSCTEEFDAIDIEAAAIFDANGFVGAQYYKKGWAIRATYDEASKLDREINPIETVTKEFNTRQASVRAPDYLMQDFHRAGGIMGAIELPGAQMAFGRAAKAPAQLAANIDAPALNAA